MEDQQLFPHSRPTELIASYLRKKLLYVCALAAFNRESECKNVYYVYKVMIRLGLKG